MNIINIILTNPKWWPMASKFAENTVQSELVMQEARDKKQARDTVLN